MRDVSDFKTSLVWRQVSKQQSSNKSTKGCDDLQRKGAASFITLQKTYDVVLGKSHFEALFKQEFSLFW